MLFIPGERCQ